MSEKKNMRLLAAAFFLPFFLLLGIYALLGIAPFGDRVLLIADARGQYLSYFALYQNLFAGKADWLYSFEKLLGGSLSGLYAYYLASPFNLFLLLFPRQELPLGVDLLILLKMSACGLTMALYLRERQGLRPASLLFTTAYALCGYNDAYAWCIMWIDAVVMLPLIALGIERLWRGKGPALYVLSLGLAIISCFYTGYMLCLFSVLYFLWRLYCDTPSLRQIPWKKLGQYALASLLAGGVSAGMLLPGFLALSGGVPVSPYRFTAKYTYPAALRILQLLLPGRESYDGLILPTLLACAVLFVLVVLAVWRLLRRGKKGSDLLGLALGIGFLIAWFALVDLPICREELAFSERRILIKLLLGYVPYWEFFNGSPNLYAGSAAFLLALSFFFNRALSRREKIAGGLLLLALLASACFYLPNLLWHGFEENNCFNYRWSFVFPFTLLMLAARSFDKSGGLGPAGLLIPWGLGITVLLLAAWRPIWFQENWMLLVCAAFLTLELGLMLLCLRGSGAARRLLCLTGVAALCLSTGLSFRDQSLNGPSRESLRSRILTESGRIDSVMDTEDGFFRIRKEEKVINYNDPMLFHYPGLVHFSSAEKLSTIHFLGQMGQSIAAKYWANGDAGESRALDALLSVGRYLGSEGYPGYEELSDGVWKNPYQLPLAFCADRNAAGEIELDERVCRNLNRVYSRLLGEDAALFLPARTEGMTLTVEREDPLYLQSWSPAITDCEVLCDGETLVTLDELHYPNAVYLGSYEPGRRLEIRVSGEETIPEPPAEALFYESTEALAACTEALKEDGCSLKISTASHIEVHTASGDDRLLVFSLPEDEGWSVTVDGVKTEPETALNILMAVPLPAGEHSVSLRYTPPGMLPGAILTALSVLALLAWELLRRKNRKSKNA